MQDQDLGPFIFRNTLSHVPHKTLFNTLQFSPNGRFLFAGGDDGVALIFDINRNKLKKSVPLASPITSALWHPRVAKTLLIGSSKGAMSVVDIDVAADDTRYTKAFSGIIGPITTNDDGTVTFIGHGSKVSMIKTPFPNAWESVVDFPDPLSSSTLGVSDRSFLIQATSLHYLLSQEILVVAYKDHGIVAWDVSDPNMDKIKLMWHIYPPASSFRIGAASFSPRLDFFVALDLLNSIDFYEYIAGGTLSYSHSIAREDSPTTLRLPITHIDRGKAILCGSATGCAKVLDARTGELIQSLTRPCYQHQTEDQMRSRESSQLVRGLDRAFAYTTLGKRSMIATSACLNERKTIIDLWVSRAENDAASAQMRSVCGSLWLVLTLILAGITAASLVWIVLGQHEAELHIRAKMLRENSLLLLGELLESSSSWVDIATSYSQSLVDEASHQLKRLWDCFAASAAAA